MELFKMKQNLQSVATCKIIILSAMVKHLHN